MKTEARGAVRNGRIKERGWAVGKHREQNEGRENGEVKLKATPGPKHHAVIRHVRLTLSLCVGN
jgi:hypothetical protein